MSLFVHGCLYSFFLFFFGCILNLSIVCCSVLIRLVIFSSVFVPGGVFLISVMISLLISSLFCLISFYGLIYIYI